MDYKFEVEQKLEQALRQSMVAEELERIQESGPATDKDEALIRSYQYASKAWEDVIMEATRWFDSYGVRIGRLVHE